jgi:hypothetical protein
MKTYKVNHDNIFDLDGDGDGVPDVDIEDLKRMAGDAVGDADGDGDVDVYDVF